MRNSPVHSIFDDFDGTADNEHCDAERVAPGSPWRLRLIGLLFFVCTAVIVARVAWVKTVLPEKYLAAIGATTTDFEILPARDGRILAQSTILATDVETYAVEIHYRWLQEPADPAWLRQQVRNRLSRDERQNETLVAQTEAAVHAERQKLRDALRQLAAITPDRLESARQRIQHRVQRIADSVNRRASTDAESLDRPSDESLLMRAASTIRRVLTSTPQRDADPRIVVREEESWHVVLEDVPLAVAAEISEHPEQFPGTRIRSATDRNYPQNHLAAHVIGARTERKETERNDTPRQTKLADDSRMIMAGGSNANTPNITPNRLGRFGVELTYNKRLSGIPGIRRIVRDRRRRIVSEDIIREPQSGRDVALTLNIPLQKTCEQLLAEALTDQPLSLLQSIEDADEGRSEGGAQPVPVGGSVVVMEAATGRLIAAASAPGFNLSLFVNGTEDEWQRANQDQRHPFIARFTGMALPPGSTFKTLTSIAALESGAVDAATPFLCQGYLQNPEEHRCLVFRHYGRGHGHISLTNALAQSCNVYYFDAAARMGILPLVDWTRRLEFGRVTGVDLPFEKTGTIPTIDHTVFTSQPSTPSNSLIATPSAATEDSRTAAARRRFERDALGLAIGQSRLTVTPLQMARMMAAVVNGGYLVTPHVVTDEGAARLSSEIEASEPSLPKTRIAGLHDESLTAIRAGLIAAVEQPAGTGYRTVRLPGLRIGGKTGTAETSPGKPDHAWFAGFAPADNPQYVFVVVLEHGGSGSHSAGPIAREVVRALFAESTSGTTSRR